MSCEGKRSSVSYKTGWWLAGLNTFNHNPIFIPLHKAHSASLFKDEVAPQRIHNHKDQLIKWCLWWLLPSFSRRAIEIQFLIARQSGHKGFVREKTCREDQNRDWN
jgi:hypothetical protein